VETLDAAELDRVLIHEWAHVQRRDDLVSILQIAVRIVAGWHPAVWWIDRRLHVEREVACDEMTVAITGSPKSYAECLLKLASLRGSARAVQAAPAVFRAPGLRTRVIRIVSPHRIAPLWSHSIAGAIVVLLCVMSAGVGRLTLVEATELARPFEPISMPLLSRRLEIREPIPSPTPSRPAEIRRGARRQSGEPARTAQRPAAESPAPSPRPEPDRHAPAPRAAVNAIDRTPVPAQRVDEPAVPPPTATASAPVPPPATETVESGRTPWNTAADAGKTVGRKSKDAGVATAGVFSRFARRVAGSF
jgi:hypothetical protein